MPPGSSNPLTGYGHGNLLEEGCVSIMKTSLKKENRRRSESVGSSDEEDVQEHENLKLQWTWTELKR
jgi:hypothetical protein